MSKAMAALAAALLLARAFERGSAYSLVVLAALWGFAGAKIYYLLEHLPTLTMQDLGRMGLTWSGGLIGGVVAALVIVRRRQLPLGLVAGVAAVPLTVAYGIGRWQRVSLSRRRSDRSHRHLNRPRRAEAQTPRDKAMTVRQAPDLRGS